LVLIRAKERDIDEYVRVRGSELWGGGFLKKRCGGGQAVRTFRRRKEKPHGVRKDVTSLYKAGTPYETPLRGWGVEERMFAGGYLQ